MMRAIKISAYMAAFLAVILFMSACCATKGGCGTGCRKACCSAEKSK